MESPCFATSPYPPGLVEFGGVVASQTFLLLATGLYSYMKAASEKQRKALSETIPFVIQNFSIAWLIHLVILTLLSWHQRVGILGASLSEVNSDRPNAINAAKQFFITVAIFEFFFYFIHRLIHRPPLYRAIHAVHHQFEEKYNENLPFANFVTHPLEFIAAYSLVLIAAALQRSHVTVLWLTGIAAGSFTMYLHSGKNIPGLMSHETHHKKPKFNFGATGFLDYLFGTLYVS
jgi:sterol desaturase/sphingolipid hydroxylase (fatty acid hydroxylase superfamily)